MILVLLRAGKVDFAGILLEKIMFERQPFRYRSKPQRGFSLARRARSSRCARNRARSPSEPRSRTVAFTLVGKTYLSRAALFKLRLISRLHMKSGNMML